MNPTEFHQRPGIITFVISIGIAIVLFVIGEYYYDTSMPNSNKD